MALTDNLRAYYKLDESSGDPADSSGNGYTLTNNGTVAFSSGKINNGADFANTSTKYFRRTGASVLGLTATTSVSVSLWFKIVSEPNTDEELFYIFHKLAAGSLIRALYYYNGGTRQLLIGRNGAVTAYASYNGNFGDNTWRHLVVVFNGSTIEYYLNGTSVASASVSGTYDSSGAAQSAGFGLSDLAFGTGDGSLNGMLDEVGVWDRALTSTEVTSLYNSGNGLAYPFSASGPANLKSYNTNVLANIKSINTNLIANVKSLDTNA